MAGEKSLLSGEAGQLITKRLLKLCGWEITEHIDFPCENGKKHKGKNSKGERLNHNVDGIFAYKNPLGHEERKIQFISSKHTLLNYKDFSPTKIYDALRDLCQCISCGKTSAKIEDEYISNFENNNKDKNEGVLTMLSSDENEHLEKISIEKLVKVSIPLENYDAVYLFDNNRVSFIYSIINKAKQLSDRKTYSFIYPDTGYNENPQEISSSGRILPIEIIKSDIVPILVKKNQKNLVLIFCNDLIEEKYLQRVIWLAHKLCAFASEIKILFPNYNETTHRSIVNKAKQKFQTSDIITNIAIKKYNYIPFTEIKEDEWEQDFKDAPSVTILPDNNTLEPHPELQKNFKEILPFGRIIRPMLASGNIVATELKKFLKLKGIFVKEAKKDVMLPILCNLILSPNELDMIRGNIIKKEEKPKQKIRISKLTGEKDKIKKIIDGLNPKILKIPLSNGCTHVLKPELKKIGVNTYLLKVKIERENTSKDFLIGKSQREGSLKIEISDQDIRSKLEYTSTDIRKFMNMVCEHLDYYLKEKNVIDKPSRKIKFIDFISNLERVEFMVSLSSLKYSNIFIESEIKNIRFCPDIRKRKLPIGIEEYSGSVKNMDLNLINRLKLFEDEEIKESILMSRIKIEYKFQLEGSSGYCIGTIHFPSALNAKSPDWSDELEITLELKNTKSLYTKIPTNSLQRKLSQRLRDLVITKYLGSYDNK